MTGQFIGFHLDHFDYGKSIPVSTGETKEEALFLAITRILSMGITNGAIDAQVSDLEPETFTQLKNTLNDFFKAKGIE